MRNNLTRLINAKTAQQIKTASAAGNSPAEIASQVETTEGVYVSEQAVTSFLGKSKAKRKAPAKEPAKTKEKEPEKEPEKPE